MLIRAFFLVAFLSLLPELGRAQWVSDSTTNTPVCTAAGIQDHPAICSDGSDGAIVVWEDLRGDGAYIIYAQRLGADGRAMWHQNGIRLTTGSYSNQRYPVVASDGHGGAYVVWQDLRNGTQGIDLYAQHINSSGIFMYDSGGRAVAFASGDQTNQQIVADGFGNAFVIWEDSRSDVSDIYMNRLTPTRVAWDSTGALLTGESNKQRGPQLCDDGHGGFYAAWESDVSTPSAIYSQRVDSNANRLWGTSPYGITVFKLSNIQNVKNVSIRRDGTQVMLAWEVSNVSSSDGQDIYATRLSQTGTKLYGSDAIQVTGNWPGDQVNPQIFSDDSAEAGFSGYSGMLVLFENNYSSPRVLQSVRVFGDGNTVQPPANTGFYQVSYTNSAESGFRALRVGPGSVMTVWNDARDDSSIYAQRLDRALSRGFHLQNTPLTWGLPICTRSTTQSKQVQIAPRTNGGIAAWTDYRNGNADIYAQLIFKDGSLPVELEQFRAMCLHRGEVNLTWKTASENGNAGFEIERRMVSGAENSPFNAIASYSSNSALRGAGTSNFERSYEYVDGSVEPAIYEYRLSEVALDGIRTTHGPVRVDARSGESVEGWALGPNQPNPFVERTTVPISIPMDAIVDISVLDVTGRTVCSPIAHQLLTTGSHEIPLTAISMGAPNGSFIVRMVATDPATGGLLWRSEQPLMITLVK